MKIAVYSLTRDRLDFTRHCFATLWDRAGCPFDHYVLDNGSSDGTPEWLAANRPRFAEVVFSDRNLGISPACNRLLELIFARGGYDLAVKIDNDCEVVTPDLLARLVEVLEAAPRAGEHLVLSPRVEGLLHPPGRERFETRHGHRIGVTGLVGGIFLPVACARLQSYRYPEDLPPGVGDDVHLCTWLRERGATIGYAEDLVVRHYLTTVGQWRAHRRYFARKDRENGADPASATPPPDMRVEEIVNPAPEPLPITVVVPISESRRAFFEGFTLPSILANRPERVVLVSGAGGASAKRNLGFQKVTSPYVFHCDDDVILARDCLKRLHEALAGAPEDVGYAYGDYLGIVIPPGHHPLGPVFRHQAKPFDPEELRRQNYIDTKSLIRSRVFAERGYDESVMRLTDWDFWLTLLENGIKGTYVPGTLFHSYYIDRGATATIDGTSAERKIRLKHALPAFEAGGLSESAAEVLEELCKPHHLRTIVELGTGTGRALEVLTSSLTPQARVFSVDSDARFLGQAGEALKRRAPAVGSVTLIHAPLQPWRTGGRAETWYSEEALAGIPGPIDLLFVDGPPGGVGRYPALPSFIERLSPRAAVVLHDCSRDGGRRILDEWGELLRGLGLELVVDLFPDERGLGRIQLLGVREPLGVTESQVLVVDADDFCDDNHGLDLLLRIKARIPNFKINLFTIVGRCSEAFLNKARELDWVDLIAHGLHHETSRECESWTYEDSIRYLDRIAPLGLTKGFKAPGWMISDGLYRALLERGYWVADKRSNDHRRPKGLRAYLLEDGSGQCRPDRRHYHIQNVCGNGLKERLPEILTLRGDFKLIKDVPALLEGAEGGTQDLPENARTLDALIKEHGFRRGAELGVRRGELTAGLLRRNPGLSMIAVDLWAAHPALNERHDHAGNFARFTENIRGLEPRVTVHRMLMSEAAREVPDGSLDFVFIDATHTHAALSEDIRTWGPKVKAQGMISGHDYHPSWDKAGLIRCVHERFRHVRVDEWDCWFAWKGDLDEQ